MDSPARPGVRERLVASATTLFAVSGFDGVSVREVCQHAETSVNMVHHYFASKDGLLRAVVAQLDESVLLVPMRLLESPARTREEFLSRVEMLFATTFEAYIRCRDVLVVAIREQTPMPTVLDYNKRFIAFVEDAKAHGFVRAEIDPAMITGAILDRILNQVHFAPFIKNTYGIDVLNDRAYQEHWSRANLDLFLNGFLA